MIFSIILSNDFSSNSTDRQKKDEEKKSGDDPYKIDKDKERKRKPAHLNKVKTWSVIYFFSGLKS